MTPAEEHAHPDQVPEVPDQLWLGLSAALLVMAFVALVVYLCGRAW